MFEWSLCTTKREYIEILCGNYEKSTTNCTKSDSNNKKTRGMRIRTIAYTKEQSMRCVWKWRRLICTYFNNTIATTTITTKINRNESEIIMFISLKTIPEPNPLGSSSTIPVPVMTSTESLRANGLERNTGIWYLLKHNWRQLTSLTPGKHSNHNNKCSIISNQTFYIAYVCMYVCMNMSCILLHISYTGVVFLRTVTEIFQ